MSINKYISISSRIHRSAGPAALVLELVHKTLLEEIPYAMCAFQGKVLIGVKNLVRLYDLGKKKLLRKSENKVSLYLLFSFLMNFSSGQQSAYF